MASQTGIEKSNTEGNFRFSVEGTEYEIGRLTLIDLVDCAEHLRKEKQKVYDEALQLFSRMGSEAADLARDAFKMRADDVMLDPEDFFGWLRSPEGIVHLLHVGIDKCMPPISIEGSIQEEEYDALLKKRERSINNIISKIDVDIINEWQKFVARSFAIDRWENVQEAAARLMELLDEIPEGLRDDILTISGFVQDTPENMQTN